MWPRTILWKGRLTLPIIVGCLLISEKTLAGRSWSSTKSKPVDLERIHGALSSCAPSQKHWKKIRKGQLVRSLTLGVYTFIGFAIPLKKWCQVNKKFYWFRSAKGKVSFSHEFDTPTHRSSRAIRMSFVGAYLDSIATDRLRALIAKSTTIR